MLNYMTRIHCNYYTHILENNSPIKAEFIKDIVRCNELKML